MMIVLHNFFWFPYCYYEKILSQLHPRFYFSFLHTTYEKILIPAIEKCLTQPENDFTDLAPDKCYDFYKTIIRPLKEKAKIKISSVSGKILSIKY